MGYRLPQTALLGDRIGLDDRCTPDSHNQGTPRVPGGYAARTGKLGREKSVMGSGDTDMTSKHFFFFFLLGFVPSVVQGDNRKQYKMACCCKPLFDLAHPLFVVLYCDLSHLFPSPFPPPPPSRLPLQLRYRRCPSAIPNLSFDTKGKSDAEVLTLIGKGEGEDMKTYLSRTKGLVVLMATVMQVPPGGRWRGGGGAYSFVAWLGRVTVDHASPSRPSTWMGERGVLLACVAVVAQWVPRFKSTLYKRTRYKSVRELRAAISACPATLKVIYFPQKTRTKCI